MNISNLVSNFYFFRKCHIKKARNRIQNKNFTLIASNCIGGIIYNNLGLRFNSPTINLQINSDEFVKLVLNLREYMQKEIKFIEPENGIPVGILGDVKITFTHYHTNEEALKKWNERKERINYDNLYIILNDRDGVTEKQIRESGNIKCKNICVFTSKDYKDIPYATFFKKYKNQECVGNVLKKSRLTGLRGFESDFDYVGWLNSDMHYGE